MKNLIVSIVLTLTFCLTIIAQTNRIDTPKNQKPAVMTTDELIKNHLASIGTPEGLASVKSRVMVGNGKISSKIDYAGQLGGPAQFASESDKLVFAIIFNSNNYPYEKAAFDGEDVTVGLPNGNRSPLSDFLKSNSAVLKEGLFGGTLSSAWSLLNIDSKKTKIEYGGTEKFDDQPYYKLRYLPRGGNLKINLFFDTKTFQHVMSEYEYVISPKIGTVTGNASQKERRFKLVEKFSNFRPEGRLTLPHTYAINLVIQDNGTQTLDWLINFSQFVFNESLDVKAFKVS